jgi:plastocyanin
MRLFRPCLLIFFLGLTTACGSSGGSSTPTTPTPTPTTPAPAPATGTQNVSIVVNSRTLGSNAYSPNPLTIAKGTTVRWTNNDTIAHTSTSDTGVFSSGNLNAGDHFDFTFQDSGTFPYHCTIHPGMVGTVVVQ